MKEIKNLVQYKSIDDIYELEGNPRTITKEKMEMLVQSIKDNPDYFEARPIICSDRTGKLVILAGNQRARAAVLAGLKEVPVVVLHGLSEEREKEIIIRDNVELGDWDMDILANEWDVDDLQDWIGEDFMQKISWADVDDLTDETYEQPEHEMLECPKCGHIDRKIHFKPVKDE